ncbi:FadR/GntR family transcriptional regulator [Alkalihalobacillus pseudalcaliphilus]|uniref:FadR/GntR family transcriptional regulator n=1 Tax=Alkalihalobacillus pseudalcaliphilus TaxID=79884 RepID=UPI00064E046E|nr:FadR/GntR family transcriptional regulator [Alkalihalobacillus pseudalcaliphilus]KMK76482.1 GntR family transcriptional regulator [Alkalihalobacillus pseudalcaliphilus]
MSLGPIKPKKMYELIAEQLTAQIKNEQLKPGERLDSVPQLAEKFQVGRSAIREALSALNAIGLIEIKQGEGTFVKEIDHNLAKAALPSVNWMRKEDLKELFEIRKIIETGAAQLAALHRTEEDLLALKQVLNEMAQNLDDGKVGEKADIVFHECVVRATKNKMLQDLLSTVSETMQIAMKEAREKFLYNDRRRLITLYKEHVEIFEAIMEQNAEVAYAKMMNHIVAVEKDLFS